MENLKRSSYLNSFGSELNGKEIKSDVNSMFIKDNMTMNTNHRFDTYKIKNDKVLKNLKAETQEENYNFQPRILSPFDHFKNSRNTKGKHKS